MCPLSPVYVSPGLTITQYVQILMNTCFDAVETSMIEDVVMGFMVRLKVRIMEICARHPVDYKFPPA